MDVICSLVHFCDIHGPTSIICTQALPASCDTCQLSEHTTLSSSGGPPSPPPAYFVKPQQKLANIKIHPTSPPISSPLATPPASPQSPQYTHNPYFPSSPLQASHRRYGSMSDDDGETCGYCTFTLPKKMRHHMLEGAPDSPTKDGRSRHGLPVLRTRERIYARGEPTPPPSEGPSSFTSSAASQPDSLPSILAQAVPKDSTPSKKHYPRSPDKSSLRDALSAYGPTSPYSDTPPLSRTSSFPPRHEHTITYLTASSPSDPATYTALRHSTLRTLSCETLAPRNPSGPLLFGDSSTGYTIAYKFRCADPLARGGIARYALTVLAGRSWKRAGLMFTRAVAVFERLAARLVQYAEMIVAREAEKDRASEAGSESAVESSTVGSRKSRTLTPVSSFLDAKTVDPDGVLKRNGSSGFLAAKAKGRVKGLAELLGEEGFFIECHVEFVRLLSALGLEFEWGW